MATYLYRCPCMNEEVEVSQPMSENAFDNCLKIFERLGIEAPAACVESDGCAVERLIAGTAGVISRGAPAPSCSIGGDKAATCGSCCSPTSGGGCPFG